MTKELFDLIVEPLGLPINGFYEYLIMAIVDVIAWKLAFANTGVMIRTRRISRRQGSDVHWTLRFTYYVVMWAILRAVIWIYRFVIANKGVSIFAAGCIAALIATVEIFRKIEEHNRYESVRIRIERNEDIDNESDGK